MTGTEITLSAGGLTTLLAQGVKWIAKRRWVIGKWVIKDTTDDLPAIFYAILVPVLAALSPFILIAVGVPSADPVLTMNWGGVLSYVLRTVITALIAFVSYNDGIKPLKDYSRLQEAKEIKFDNLEMK